MNIIIVSRHPAAIEFIRREARLADDTPVLASATPADVTGAVVYGNLPLHLAALAGLVVAVEFDGDPPRGAEYGLAEMDAAGAHLTKYRVQTIADSPTNTITWCNRQGSRDRKAYLHLVDATGVIHEFSRESIPGVVAVTGVAWQKAGKWSNGTFSLSLAPGVRALCGHFGWETGTLAEALASESHQRCDNWDDCAGIYGTSREETERFVRSHSTRTAKIFDDRASAIEGLKP